MELDRKVREFPISAEALALVEDLEAPPDAEPPSPSAAMQSSVMSHSREVSAYIGFSRCVEFAADRATAALVLLYIHRSFFVQSIIDCPENPLRSAYAPSFLAAYRASSIILKMIREQYTANPNIATRFWSNWTFSFSASV